jgi:hypothetical protein
MKVASYLFSIAFLALCFYVPAARGESVLRAETARCLLIPPDLDGRVLFCQSYEFSAKFMQMCAPGLHVISIPPLERETAGRVVKIDGNLFSANWPLTVSFWWKLTHPLNSSSGFSLMSLNGKGYISLFVRSGPWCGLKKPSGVLQVYNFPGIRNYNGIYDDDILRHMDLSPGKWHHTAVVFTAASMVQAYTDGKLVCKIRTLGRDFTALDDLHSLIIGDDGPCGMVVDSILLVDKPLNGGEVQEYETAIRQMRQSGYFER